MITNEPEQMTKAVGLRLDDNTLARILDQLDAESRPHDGNGKRGNECFAYRHKSLDVQLHLSGGETLGFRAPSRELSADGISFLHSGYVHLGTRCRIQLVTIHNNWQPVDGSVIRCRYVEGRVHDVGVRFDKPIEISSFASSAVPRRILVVDDERSIVRLTCHFLEKLNTKVSVATNGEEAIQQAQAQIFDAILMDVEMPVLDGIAALERLRRDGYQGSVVAMTALSSPGDRERLLESGFDRYIAKPVTQEALSKLLDTLNEEPLFSTLVGKEGMNELITQFVRDLAERVRALEQALAKQDVQYIQQLARQIKGEAGGYGFEPITAIAQEVEQAAKAAPVFSEIEPQVKDLIKLCSLARPPTS